MRSGGAAGSENVGMSNRNPGESPGHRKPQVSLAMLFNQGLAGSKPVRSTGTPNQSKTKHKTEAKFFRVSFVLFTDDEVRGKSSFV